MKNEVGQRNSTFKLTDMQNLASDVLEDISPEIVKNCFTHVDKIEKIYWESDGLNISPVVENIVINLQDSCSSQSDEPEE